MEKKRLHNLGSDQTGLSLIELLVSMVIGLGIIAGVVQIYGNQVYTTKLQESNAYIQESARFALYMLANDLKTAGYYGCTGIKSDGTDFRNNLDSADYDNLQVGIAGWEATDTAYATDIANDTSGSAVLDVISSGANWSSGAMAMNGSVKALPATDVIRIFTGNELGLDILTFDTEKATLTVGDSANIYPDDLLFLSDCVNTALVQACAVDGVTISMDGCTEPGNVDIIKLPSTLEKGQVFLAQKVTYWIGKLNDNSANPPSLFREDSSGTMELVTGVENMQILYGEDQDSDLGQGVDRYVSADDVVDWTSVRSVKVSLLLQSRKAKVLPRPKDYTYHGANHTTSDYRDRRIFSTTISLRNRSVGTLSN